MPFGLSLRVLQKARLLQQLMGAHALEQALETLLNEWDELWSAQQDAAPLPAAVVSAAAPTLSEHVAALLNEWDGLPGAPAHSVVPVISCALSTLSGPVASPSPSWTSGYFLTAVQGHQGLSVLTSDETTSADGTAQSVRWPKVQGPALEAAVAVVEEVGGVRAIDLKDGATVRDEEPVGAK